MNVQATQIATFERHSFFERLGRRRRLPFAAPNIRRSILSILFCSLSNRCDLVGLRRFKHLLQERHAPAAASPGATTFADLTGHARTVNPQKVLNLSLADMKAVTQFVIGLHGVVL